MKNKYLSLVVLSIVCFSFKGFTKNIRSKEMKQSITEIIFKLEAGSRLFVSYPINLIEEKELIIPNVMRDTIIILSINSQYPFTFFNFNKIRTQYLLFPNLHYFVNVKKSENILYFKCDDNFKEVECNILCSMQNKIGKLDLSTGDKNFINLTKEKKYNRKLDSFYLNQKIKRLDELNKYKTQNRISPEGFVFLSKYIEMAFVRNRFVQFYDNGLDKKYLSNWYKDTMIRYLKVFTDTSLINTSVYKSSLRCMNLFLALFNNNDIDLKSQFCTAKDFSAINNLNQIQLFNVMNSRNNKIEKSYSYYIDSFLLYCTNDFYKKIIIDNYNLSISSAHVSNSNFILINSKKQLLLMDSLIKKQKKIVVIDLWASWCLPCLKQLRESDKIIEEYKNKNISFLYFSLDENIEKWVSSKNDFQFMNEYNSFLVKESFNSELAKKYSIGSIPNYFIIRNDGILLKNQIWDIKDPFIKSFLDNLLESL